MAESVVSPTPVFMGEINSGWPRAVNPSVTGIATDTHLAILGQLAELRHNQVSSAATLAEFRVSVADRFASLRTAQLEGEIAAMRAAKTDGTLADILAKLASKVA